MEDDTVLSQFNVHVRSAHCRSCAGDHLNVDLMVSTHRHGTIPY